MNERITENIVRNYLREKGYYIDENIIVEEQISLNPRISKWLKGASKSGNGIGKPEFIISFKNESEDVMIIECKASIFNHESKDRKNPKDFSVDGVLHYSSFLKNDFNVTAIAISGSNEKEIKLSTFLWLKKNYIYKDIQDKIFLNPKENKDIIKQSLKPFDEEDLIQKSIDYNNHLHNYSIPEVERCTLVSAILIALQSKAFLNSFRDHESNKALIESLLNECKSVLSKSELPSEKIEIILSEYSKFRHNSNFNSERINNKKTKQSEKNTVLKDFILRISEDILPYINQSDFDILGKFYTQFIRHAGGDKKTGLVLTPMHITEFFCYLAEITKDDVILDPCCGTAGFLVAAMNFMLSKAGNDSNKKKNIKSKQLIGIEKRSDMFSHACSNMMMRGDGKSKIIYGDCFDENIKNEVKKLKPTKGLLNPPYQDGNAAEQLEFIENTLECLMKNGTSVAICQISTVVSDKNEVKIVKERLLNKHTLKAVLSMPNDLFSPVGVVTCILIFSAHNPHPKNQKVFFGYFKDDGLIKNKNKGRIDYYNKWKDIRSKWIDLYINRENFPGISINELITADDEWCAEAYIKTDYLKLDKNKFEETVRNYCSFLIKHNKFKQNKEIILSKESNEIVLNITKWKEFKIKAIFNLKRGQFSKKPKKEEIYFNNKIPYISSTETDNGCLDYYNIEKIDNKKIEKGNCITVANNGSVGSSFYHGYDFICSSDATVLRNEKLNIYNSLFLTTIIGLEKFKFNYGRKWSNTKMMETVILLPTTISGEIDWYFMEEYIKKLDYSQYL